MTDVEIAEQTIATLTDKLNAATKRASEIAAERQKIGYLVDVGNDEPAQAKLAKLTAELSAFPGGAGAARSTAASQGGRRTAWRDQAAAAAQQGVSRSGSVPGQKSSWRFGPASVAGAARQRRDLRERAGGVGW
jgi:hypothetical protein